MGIIFKDIDNLSLTNISKNDIDINRYRKLVSRIKQFQKQIKVYNNGSVIKTMEEIRHLDILKECIRLVKYSPITYRQVCREVDYMDNVEKHFYDINGCDYIKPDIQYDLVLKERLVKLKDGKDMARKLEDIFRWKLEIKRACAQKEYIVFNTLTVRPESYQEVWKKGSLVWRKFIESIEKDVGLENHVYFAVIEGKTQLEKARLHIHVMHLFKKLPKGTMDPNYGKSPYKYREITSIKKYWKYGFSTPIAVRFNIDDSFGRLGWIWPVEYDEKQKQYVQIKTGTPGKIAGYMGKYLLKNDDKKKGITSWRKRETRKPRVGMKLLTNSMKHLKINEMNVLLKIKKTGKIVLGYEKVPMNLIHMEATRQIQNYTKNLSKKEKIELLMDVKSQKGIIQRMKYLTKKILISNHSSSINTEIQITEDMVVSKLNKVIKLECEKMGIDYYENPNYELKGYQKAV